MKKELTGISNNPKLCITLHHQNAHLLRVTSAFAYVANFNVRIIKNLLILLYIFAALPFVSAQQNAEKILLSVLFEQIEAQTPYRIFCPPYTDTLKVARPNPDRNLVEHLRSEAVRFGLAVSIYKNDLLITSNAPLRTELPVGYFEPVTQQVSTNTVTVFDIANNNAVAREHDLDEVVVTSDRMRSNNVRNTTMGVTYLMPLAAKNIPVVFGERDIIRIVTSLPGVKTAGEVSGGFNVRGGATDQNLILFNGGTIYNPMHLFGLSSAINFDAVHDIELYKGSIPVKYGGRISSVLDIRGKEGSKADFAGSAKIGILSTQLTFEGPLFGKNTSYLLSGRTTYSDWLLNQLPENSGYRDGKAGFYDLNANINHRFNNYNNLTLSGYFSRDHFSFVAGEGYAYRNANANARWNVYSDRLTSGFSAGYDHYDYRTQNDAIAANAYSLTFDVNQYFFKMDFQYKTGSHTIDFGGNSMFYQLNPGQYLHRGDSSLVADDRLQTEKALESALYIGDRWDLHYRFSVDVGLRYSMFNALGAHTYNIYNHETLPSLSTITGTKTVGSGSVFKTYHGPEFRASVRYEFIDNFSLKAGFNSMRQYIHKLSNTTIMAPTDTWKLSDMNIKPQTGSQVSVGLYKNFPAQSIETSVEAYYKTMDDYLDYRSGAQLLMNHHIETDVIETEGKAYGIELMLKKTQGMLNGWISYTYSRTLLRQHDQRIISPVNRGEWYPSDYDKPHDVKLAANYKFTHRYSLSVNCDYSTGRPISLPVSKYNYIGGEFVFITDRNQFRIPDYFRLDISYNIEPKHHLTKLTHSSVSLGVYNVTGRKNIYSVYFVAEQGKLKSYSLSVFGAPIPYITYNIRF